MDRFHCVSLVLILSSVKVEFLSGAEGLARALDLSWRPLSHSPYQQQFFPNNAPAALISYSHFDAANKDEIVEAAKHNAQLLKKFKEISNHPITSYSDPYQLHSQTPAPQSKVATTFQNLNRPQQQHLIASASNHVLSRLPFPVKSVPLYQTKLTFLGKPDVNAIYHQNSIHQTGTTPKVAGFTKEYGRVNFHYHHPSITSSLSTSTKRIPVFSSSVTPQPGYHGATKMHPVMTKFQAHMALASQSHQNKLKLQQNFGFSPPSQVMSNYANFGPATSNPFWHSGFGKQNGMHHHLHDFHPSYHLSSTLDASQHQQYQQQHQNQNQQQQQQNHKQQHHNQNYQQQHHNQQQVQSQNQPSVHPSVLTPFLDQVLLKQKEVAAEQKNAHKQSQEATSTENNGSFEIINDVFSKNLVPPPPSAAQNFNSKKQQKEEKLNKYNLSMKSPLQDATRFNYENVISTAVTPTPLEPQRFKPSASDNTFLTTDKPKVFGNLNRPRDNVYKQHKLLHPSYTGNAKKKPAVTVEKPFLPTPYKPEKEEEEIKIDGFEPQHSYFTIEDAVTPKLYSHHVVKSHIPVDETKYLESAKIESTKFTLTTPSEPSAVEQQTPKPKQKLRRRKPKPKQPIIVEDQKDEASEKPTVRPNQLRGSIKNSDTRQENDLRTKKRVNSVRNKLSFSSPAATSTTFDYDSTIRPSTEDVRHEEITTVHHFTTEIPTSAKADESSERPENLKRRVRLRYKNKLRQEFNSVESNEFKGNTPLTISEAESENVPIKQFTESYEQNSIGANNTFNETRSTLRLPNLKLRNEVLTTFSPSVESFTSPASASEITSAQENNLHSKIVNRPRFSIKEIKRKQLSSSPTATILTTTTTSTTAKPDSQRFNRLRVSLNRRRNETNDSSEDLGKRKFSSSRPSTTITTTESTTQTPKRGNLPKRTFPARNFTRPVTVESETSTSLKPSTKPSTVSNNLRIAPSIRSRIQSYKRKETLVDLEETTAVPTRKADFSSEAVEPLEELTATTTSTELPPIKHETSIMKIAKTPSTVNVVKSTTSNSIEPNETSRSDFDLTGSPSEHSQRVAELTISGNDNSFKSANIGPLSRRIPNYFTISTDDPILPIQAFFPQIKANEEANLTK